MTISSICWRRLLLSLIVCAAFMAAATARAAAPADLLIRATARSFRVGLKGTYTITVSNKGPSATDDVITISDTLPAGLQFVSGLGFGWTCTAAAQAVQCTRLDSLTRGRTVFLRINVFVDSVALPSVSNTIAVAYAGDANPANDTVTKTTAVLPGRNVTPVATPTPIASSSTPTATETAVAGATATLSATALPSNTPTVTLTPTVTRTPTTTPTTTPAATDLSLGKTTSSPFTVGSNALYTLTVSNVGAASTNAPMTVTDTLPAGLTYVSATGGGWTCSATGQVVICGSSDALSPGSTTSITLTVAVSEAAYPTVTNSATLAYDADSNTANNTAHKPTTIRQ